MSGRLDREQEQGAAPRGDRRPRVAYLTNQLLDWQTREPRFGGGERYCLTLGRLLREQGFEVTFYQAAHAAFEGEYYGFKVVALPVGEPVSEFHPEICDAFYDLTTDYDHVIHNIPTYASGRIRDDAVVICHMIWFDHNNYPPPIVFRTSEWFTHLYRAFSRPRKVVSVDTNAINVIRALWPELTSRITYIPNWVDTDLFRPPESRKSDPVTIIFPRRAERTRGSRILGEILERIPHDCRVQWVGDGEPEDNEIIKGVARRDPRLEFYTASFEQMPSFYQEADICVISTVGSEGTSLSCLEGLASGCAVVATNVGGLPNLIQPEVNGLLVDPEAGEIARGINRLIERAEERAYYQAAGIRTAGNFTRGVWEGRWLDLLSHLGWIEQRTDRETRVMKDPMDLTIDRPQKSYFVGEATDRQRDVETIRHDSARYDVICFRGAGGEAEGRDFERREVERPDVERRGEEIVALFAEAGHRVFLLSASQYVSPDERPYRAEALRERVWEVKFAATGSISEDLAALRAEFNITRAISLLQSPEWEGAARTAKNEFGWTLVYDCSNDPVTPSGGADKVALEEGQRLARGADLALVASEPLRDRWSAVGANVLLVAQPDITAIKQAVEKARHRAHVAELLKTVTSELLQEGVTPWGEDEKARLLKKTALHLTASLAEREQALQAMKTRLAEREQAARLLSAEMDVKEKIIAARDEAIVWLRGELEVFRKERQRLVDLNQSLKAEALEKKRLAGEIKSLEAELARQRESYDEEMQDLAARLAEEEDRSQGLAAELADREADFTRLAAASEEQGRKLEEVESLLLDRVQAVQYRTAQVEERERIIAAREEAIIWLKEELTEAQKKSQRLAATNQLLSSQLSKKEHARQTAAARAEAVEGQLEKIERTLGWRLLSRYGRIKYRYLLPLYRMLKLPAEYGPLERQMPAPAAANGSEGQAADEERIIESLLAQLAELDERPARSVETRERQETRRADFYESLTLLPHLDMDELPAILDHEPPAAPRYRADVICFSIIDWEFRYQRPQQIMSQFAAHGHRVFYISTTRFRPDSAAPRVFVKAIKENVFEVQLAAERMPNVYNEVFEGGNRDALLESLDELRRTYHIDEAIGYAMIASWGSLALETQARWGWRLVYDCMDEWENFPGINREILDMEIRLVRECDLLVVTAQRLYDKWSKYNRPMALARNAVDYDFYRERLHPNTALAQINHPVVGYYGAIADWFDVELMTAIARARPNYTFVLIGGVFEVDVSELKSLANVRLLGQQPYEMMPQYLYHFDACIIPFKINAITEATDPVKLYEYLSGGKPVVSVALPELEPYRDYLYTAEGRDDFLAKLDLAVAEEDREMAARRRELARQHTWEERYKVIGRAVADVTPRASIIVVTYNNLALNKLCLEGIIRNTDYPNYEVIVVDNNSTDGSPAYLRFMASKYPQISIILNPNNNGFARANNQGIERATGEYIVLLNNDTVVPPGWLSRLVRHLRVPEVGMVGPVTNFVGNEAKIDVPYQSWAELERFAKEYTWEHDGQVADIHMLAMFCVAFRRETYDAIGPLDEQFGIGMFEDDDYSQRMKAEGYRVICAADSFVHHFGQAAFKKLIETGEYNPLFDENRRRYETKWNVKWIPHKHARLKFERLAAAAERGRSAAGSKSAEGGERERSQ